MIKITIGIGENKNILDAIELTKDIEDLEISLVNNEKDLLNSFDNDEVNGIIRGSLKSSKVLKSIKEKYNHPISRATYIHNNNYDCLIIPVGIDEGKSLYERFISTIQGCEFLEKLNIKPKIAILADGRKDDYGRTREINESLKESEDLEQLLKEELKEKDYSIKNYYILIEEAIKDNCNIIIAPNGIFGNILFRTLVLVNKWPSYGAITLGINKIYIDTSRSQTTEAYFRSIKLGYKLAKLKKEI